MKPTEDDLRILADQVKHGYVFITTLFELENLLHSISVLLSTLGTKRGRTCSYKDTAIRIFMDYELGELRVFHRQDGYDTLMLSLKDYQIVKLDYEPGRLGNWEAHLASLQPLVEEKSTYIFEVPVDLDEDEED